MKSLKRYPQALRVVWLPILTTLSQSELPDLGSPPSSDLSADLSHGILGGASLDKLVADSRGRLVRRQAGFGRAGFSPDRQASAQLGFNDNNYDYNNDNDDFDYDNNPFSFSQARQTSAQEEFSPSRLQPFRNNDHDDDDSDFDPSLILGRQAFASAGITPSRLQPSNAFSHDPLTAPLTRLRSGDYLSQGQCQYSCKDTGGCSTQLVVDWASDTQNW